MLVAKQVDRHPPHPADRVVVVAQPAPTHVGPHERLLHGVGGVLGVSARERQRAHKPLVVGAEHILDLRRRRTLDQGRVGLQHGAHHRLGHDAGVLMVGLNSAEHVHPHPRQRAVTAGLAMSAAMASSAAARASQTAALIFLVAPDEVGKAADRRRAVLLALEVAVDPISDEHLCAPVAERLHIARDSVAPNHCRPALDELDAPRPANGGQARAGGPLPGRCRPHGPRSLSADRRSRP